MKYAVSVFWFGGNMDNELYDEEYNDAKKELKQERVNNIQYSICAFLLVSISIAFTGYVMLMSFSVAIVPLHYLWRFVKWILGGF